MITRGVSTHVFYSAVAHAAALGFDYPGVHGAPDLFGPAHHGMIHDTVPARPHHYENAYPHAAGLEPDLAYNRRVQPKGRFLSDSAHKQAFPWGSESPFLLRPRTYEPVQTEYYNSQWLSLPRGHPFSNPKSNVAEVKHGAPSARHKAPGQSDLLNWDSEGQNAPLSFVYNEPDLVVDESVPNRYGMSGFPLPQSRGHNAYKRGLGLTGYILKRGVPVIGSFRLTRKDHVAAFGPGSAVGGSKRVRFPNRIAQPRLGGFNVKRFVQSNPVPRRKPISGSYRISQ